MTIVVYDGETIAADRQVTSGNVITGFIKKIEHWSGGVFAFAGAETDNTKLRRYLEKGYLPKFSKGFCAIFTRDNKVWLMDKDMEPWPAYNPSAVGSSFDIAEMLVREGYTAKEAVKVVCKHDIHCGGRIDVVNVR